MPDQKKEINYFHNKSIYYSQGTYICLELWVILKWQFHFDGKNQKENHF